jgi:hypothetical protein
MDEDREQTGTQRWFGSSWGAPACQRRTHIDTPTDSACTSCRLPISEGDRGVRIPAAAGFAYFHFECWMDLILGPVHLSADEHGGLEVLHRGDVDALVRGEATP